MNDYPKQEYLYIQLIDGLVKIQLFSEEAPNHVKRIKELANSGFYNKLKFFRVIPNFIVQTGCPQGTGTGGSNVKLEPEFNSISHTPGTCSMARTSDLNSADSQFFICLDNLDHLNEKYTVWGQVIEGFDYIKMIKSGSLENNGMVEDPDIIIKAWVE